MAALADRTAMSLIENGIDKCVLIGVSLGSMIAQRIAATHPEIVEGAVLANGIALATEAVRESWETRIADTLDGGMKRISADTIKRWFTPEFLNKEQAWVRRIEALVCATDLAGYCNAAQAIATLDNRDVMPAIRCPVLVLSGSHDIAAPAAIVESVAQKIADAQIQRIDAPHLAQIEEPDLFNKAVDTFLKQLPGYGA